MRLSVSPIAVTATEKTAVTLNEFRYSSSANSVWKFSRPTNSRLPPNASWMKTDWNSACDAGQ